MLLVSYIGLVALFAVLGFALTGRLNHTSVVAADRRVAQWFVTHRTPRWDLTTALGSDISDTFIKIGLSAVVAGGMLIVWRRWVEPLLIVVPLVLEAAVFITVTSIVGRPRPDVVRLEGSPVGSSYPSGHAAAATVYAAFAVVVFWHTRRHLWRVLAVVVTALIPVVGGLSRMY